MAKLSPFTVLGALGLLGALAISSKDKKEPKAIPQSTLDKLNTFNRVAANTRVPDEVVLEMNKLIQYHLGIPIFMTDKKGQEWAVQQVGKEVHVFRKPVS